MSIQESTQEVYLFLEKYVQYLESMVEGEKEKLSAILSNDLKRIDQSVSSQQAVAMQMDTLEKKRLHLQREAGFGEADFGEIVSRSPASHRQAMEKLYERMHGAVSDIRYYNDRAMDIVKLNLQRFGSAPNPPASSGYGSQRETYQGNLYEKKI